MADLALCHTCRVWHTVEMKEPPKEEHPAFIDYGTHTLPKKFWTPKKAELK